MMWRGITAGNNKLRYISRHLIDTQCDPRVCGQMVYWYALTWRAIAAWPWLKILLDALHPEMLEAGLG